MSFELFSAPTPGQSLTQEPGAASYEHPPQYTDVNQALEAMFEKLSDPRQATRLVLMLKKGTPVEYITRTILYDGFMKGLWTPDVALLMGRIMMAMIIAIGTAAGVKKLTIFNPDREQEQFLDQFLDMAPDEDPTVPEAPEGPAGDVLPKFTGLLGAQM